MISYSHLLLLITIAATTTATQLSRDNASEGRSTSNGYISDWRGLKKAYP